MEEVFELEHADESATVQHIVDRLMEECLSDITDLDEETHKKTTQFIWEILKKFCSPSVSLSLEELQEQGVKTFEEQDHLVAALQYGRRKRHWIHQSVHTRWRLNGDGHNRTQHRRKTTQKPQKERKETARMIEVKGDTIIPKLTEAIDLVPSDVGLLIPMANYY